eukprot:TRINITY_DN2047_c0_g1_i3.p1 TRINITY_DN2047_c0_g1~~TRINITY_DN2047_c0_g1_i3.p1  ORF type:complete len:358 (-),score=21.92 TRINITY_DN2047_c0_g1_i3:159-1232(-)
MKTTVLLLVLLTLSGTVLSWSWNVHMIIYMIAEKTLENYQFDTPEKCKKLPAKTKGANILKYIDKIGQAEAIATSESKFLNMLAGEATSREKKEELQKKAFRYVNRAGEVNKYSIAFWSDDYKKDEAYRREAHFLKQIYDGKNKEKPIGEIPLPGNVIYAFDQAYRFLTRESGIPMDRARILAHLIHIVGDMHQPLHMMTCLLLKKYEITEGKFQEDDNGGNFIVVKGLKGFKGTLHKLWDRTMGGVSCPLYINKETIEFLKAEAEKTMKDFGRPEKLEKLRLNMDNMNEFKEEMFQIGTKIAYKGVDLEKMTKTFAGHNKMDDIKEVDATCRRQIALAGYRLALYFTDIYFANNCC